MSEITEKTIHLDSARLFRVRTELAVLEATVRIHYTNPVEVRSGKERIGWASIEVQAEPRADKQYITANLVFSYESPERLSIESKSEKLYARIEGVHSMIDEPYEHVGLYTDDLPVLESIHILGIVINRRPGFWGQEALGEAVL